MADQPPFLTSPKFISKKLSECSETVVCSPVSVLETKNSSISTNPFAFHDTGFSKSSTPSSQNQHPVPKKPTEAIGLALIYSIVEEDTGDDGNFPSKPVSRMALLGSKPRIQFPATNTPSPPSEFGTKTKSSQLCSSFPRSRDLIRHLSLKEMELYEDYTCVITHGPHPKTTHIFDDYIVENSDDDDHPQEKDIIIDCPTQGFCGYCKELLKDDDKEKPNPHSEQKPFCSEECRFQEMIHSEGMKIEEP